MASLIVGLTHARAAFLSQVNGPEKQELLQLIGTLVDETAYNQRVSATSPKRRRRVTPLDRWLRPNPFHGQTRLHPQLRLPPVERLGYTNSGLVMVVRGVSHEPIAASAFRRSQPEICLDQRSGRTPDRRAANE